MEQKIVTQIAKIKDLMSGFNLETKSNAHIGQYLIMELTTGQNNSAIKYDFKKYVHEKDKSIFQGIKPKY